MNVQTDKQTKFTNTTYMWACSGLPQLNIPDLPYRGYVGRYFYWK